MKNKLILGIVFGGMIGGILNANAQCTQALSCEELGYIHTSAECTRGGMLKCPFDTTKVLCNHVAVVGDLKYSLQVGDHDGWLLASGHCYDDDKYPELEAFIGTSFGIYKESDMIRDEDAYCVGKPKLPNYINRYPLAQAIWQSVDAKWIHNPANAYVAAGLPNITGRLGTYENHLFDLAGGDALGLTGSSGSNSYHTSGGRGTVSEIGFNAHWSNPIYGSSSTVQPLSFRANLFIYGGKIHTN